MVHSGVNVPSFMLFLVVLVVLRDGSWIEAGGRADQAANRLLGHGESDAVVAKGAER